jgi:VanZ family protein
LSIVFALLLAWTLEDVQSRSHRFLVAFFIALAFGAAMEWLQTKVPGRIGNFFDIVLNAAGAAIGLLVAAFML